LTGATSSFPARQPLVFNATWPLPNVWLGVSAERQQEADERIPDLLATPAAIRFLSAEPLLGRMNLHNIAGRLPFMPERHDHFDALHPDLSCRLDWIIAGGESGAGARPMHPDWARGLRDQCAATGVPFFFKQWGAWLPTSSVDVYCHGPDRKTRLYPDAEGLSFLTDGRICLRDFSVAEHKRRIRSGAASSSRAIEVDRQAIADFHTSIEDQNRTADNPLGYQWMYRVGKKAAGRLLDGVEHNGMPERISA
jgi:protein gp37